MENSFSFLFSADASELHWHTILLWRMVKIRVIQGDLRHMLNLLIMTLLLVIKWEEYNNEWNTSRDFRFLQLFDFRAWLVCRPRSPPWSSLNLKFLKLLRFWCSKHMFNSSSTNNVWWDEFEWSHAIVVMMIESSRLKKKVFKIIFIVFNWTFKPLKCHWDGFFLD